MIDRYEQRLSECLLQRDGLLVDIRAIKLTIAAKEIEIALLRQELELFNARADEICDPPGGEE